jgi:hypothetical protein
MYPPGVGASVVCARREPKPDLLELALDWVFPVSRLDARVRGRVRLQCWAVSGALVEEECLRCLRAARVMRAFKGGTWYSAVVCGEE